MATSQNRHPHRRPPVGDRARPDAAMRPGSDATTGTNPHENTPGHPDARGTLPMARHLTDPAIAAGEAGRSHPTPTSDGEHTVSIRGGLVHWVAWAAAGPDEALARELAETATRAAHREAAGVALAAFERAVQLSEDPAERGLIPGTGCAIAPEASRCPRQTFTGEDFRWVGSGGWSRRAWRPS
jgi:hypothetical protein